MRITRRITTIACLATVSALAAVPVASASYDPPADPGTVQKPSGNPKTINVSKSCSAATLNKTCFSTIQAGVNKTKQFNKSTHQAFHTYDYTVIVGKGTYNETVAIEGHGFDGLTLKGATTNPRDVKIDLRGLDVEDQQNGVLVNATSGVTVKYMSTFHYSGNGFFFKNIGVTPAGAPEKLFGSSAFIADHLIAGFSTGTNGYGLYEFNSIGGTFSNDEGYYNSDAGLYIGQTPVQTKPVRSLVTGGRYWGNELGYSGTNSKYVTITKGKWFNNGIGLVPNMLLSEAFYPPEKNVIIDNDIYGNNFNFFSGAPHAFPVAHGALGDGADYPPGMGILLFGSKDTIVQNNRIYNNHLVGFGMMNPGVLIGVKTTAQSNAAKIERNQVIGNAFGNTGKNKNGVDIFYLGGQGDGTCIGGNGAYANTGVLRTIGQEGAGGSLGATTSRWNKCPTAKTSKNVYSLKAFTRAADYVGDPTHQSYWQNTTGQTAIPGYKPLEACTVTAPYLGCDGQQDGKP